MRKKARRSQFVNDKQLYSQSNGHNLKKTFTTLRFCGVLLEALFKICPDEKLKNCWINCPFTWYRKRATPTDLFSVSSLMMHCLPIIAVEWYKRNFSFYLQYMLILSRFTSRRTRPIKPQNRKPNISAASLHLKIKKHF